MFAVSAFSLGQIIGEKLENRHPTARAKSEISSSHFHFRRKETTSSNGLLCFRCFACLALCVFVSLFLCVFACAVRVFTRLRRFAAFAVFATRTVFAARTVCSVSVCVFFIYFVADLPPSLGPCLPLGEIPLCVALKLAVEPASSKTKQEKTSENKGETVAHGPAPNPLQLGRPSSGPP